MSIVKKLVDQMNGTIVVDSQIGKGSVVRITLPIRVDEAWSTQPADAEQNLRSNIAGMRVLLVEDNEINCEIVEFMLKEAGAEVVTAVKSLWIHLRLLSRERLTACSWI